jgi:hypothetical protein
MESGGFADKPAPASARLREMGVVFIAPDRLGLVADAGELSNAERAHGRSPPGSFSPLTLSEHNLPGASVRSLRANRTSRELLRCSLRVKPSSRELPVARFE